MNPLTCDRPPVSCRLCGHPKVSRPRGLCWRCFYAHQRAGTLDAVAPSANRYGVGLNVTGQGERRPPEPTAASPGTADKLAVLAARAAAGQPLFHPADAR